MSQSIVDDIDTSLASNAKIKVIGVGGGGGNAVQNMIASGLRGVQFVCANTDVQALGKNGASVKVQMGEKLTKGLGAGANPSVGREAAVESVNAIREAIGDAVPLIRVGSLIEAVEHCRAVAEPGDAVLLSPACASFDMFRDYAHRAEIFRDAVSALAQQQGTILEGGV